MSSRALKGYAGRNWKEGREAGEISITVRARPGPSWELTSWDLDLNVNRSETILEVKRKLCGHQFEISKSEISLEKSTLLYAGKILTDQNSLEYYNIRDWATIDFITHRSRIPIPSTETKKPVLLHYPEISTSKPGLYKLPTPVLPTEIIKPAELPSPEVFTSIPVQSTQTSKSAPVLLTATSRDDAAFQSHKYWETKAREGDFDEDLHIVDPHSHFHLMDKLKRDVIGAFQYLALCLRINKINDASILDDAALMAKIGLRPGTLAVVTRALTGWTALEGTGTIQKLFWQFFGSYVMMLNALRSLGKMRRSQFCRNSISFFSELESTGIIELKSIAVRLVIDIENEMEKTLIRILENLEGDPFATILSGWLLPSCQQLLQSIGFPVPQLGSMDLDVSLKLIWTTVLFLNHTLVSYVKSHDFDADSLDINVNEQSLDSGRADALLPFRCSGVKLACLDAFVHGRRVFVFQIHGRMLRDGFVRDPPRSVLARLADIEDIWGPVYTVPSNSGLVKYYGVSKGVICRVESKQQCPIQGAIPCHYFTHSSFFRRKASRLLSGSEDLLLAKEDLLLIGTGLRENPHCTYHIVDFCRDWAPEMTVLGTQESVWKTDTRSIAVGLSKYVGVTVSGSQKLMP
ncbi:MAG: hypothetical protein LQ350_002276 [Teloschistes chrysophthalmus]|nr:MAG: hypothetical protein LQ350_002276 [Niorma chrysophthalma]